MHSAVPRSRRARPMAEAPIDALAARAEDVAKAWLVALIEREPLSEAQAVLAREWALQGPAACTAVLRALGSDRELERIGAETASFAGPRGLDALRAVIWSALRSTWSGCEADQVWDLGERLTLVIEALRPARGDGAPAGGRWPDRLQEAVARAQREGAPLALMLVELGDADRILAVESAEDCVAVLGRFRDAVQSSAGPGQAVPHDAEGRAWVIAPGSGRERALALGSSIAAAVRRAPPWRGAPLTATVGLAVLGEDGADAESLIGAAEEAVLAGTASGIEIERQPG